MERFNCSFRPSILDANLFDDITQVQLLAEEWVNDYNSKSHMKLWRVKYCWNIEPNGVSACSQLLRSRLHAEG
ncbi:integrase core domain-containing protein [Pedobacter sp. MR2016-24]|uniref:integrase core domain-containing protein n=1 Tax=Pedobacter sp. MR2016-24 TaxID=2994466 RepID=UPI003A4D411F